MAKWKSNMDAQKERQKPRGKEKPDPENSDLEYVKSQAQKIIDLISKDQEPPPLSKFQQVCEVIQRVINNSKATKAKQEKGENDRILSECESKINEIEREKIYLRRENQELKKRIEELENRLTQSSLTSEMLSLLKDSQQRLMDSNSLLCEDIKLLKQAQADKDRLWELELLDIQQALSKSPL